MHAPPGVRFLVTGLAYLSALLFTTTTFHRYAIKPYFHAEIPTWAIITTPLVILLLATYVPVWWKTVQDRRAAKALGAQVVSKLMGKRFGNLDVLMRMQQVWQTGYPGDELPEFFDRLGSVFNMYIMHSDLYFTASPEHIKLVLATDFHNYVKGERFKQSMDSVLGTGVFNSDGEMWKFHRSITRPAFTRDRISDYELFDRHAKTVISQLKTRLREGHAVDFQDLMSRFTLDSATEFLFGTCAHSLSAGLPYPHNVSPPPPSSTSGADPALTAATNAFTLSFFDALMAIAHRERYGWIWPLFEMFEDNTRKPMKIVDGFIEPIIKEALLKKKAGLFGEKEGEETGPEHLEEGETLLDHLVKITEDPKVIKDETLNIMIAGRDTTAGTLTFVIYLLAMHPHVMSRLREEILEKVGPMNMPTKGDIKEMKYLRAVINETLRLFPIVPFNTRESVNPTTWPNPNPNQKPYYIPGGTKVVYSVYMMQRRKDLWGPDADHFDPDRFLDDRSKTYLVKNPFIFLPFNAGPRICLGQQFAYNEMSFMLVRLLQSFSSVTLDPASAPPDTLPPPEWKSSPGRKGMEQVIPRIHLTMYSLGGLWVKMEEATGST